MTELEKLLYTKDFIDKLADGVNPLTDERIPEGDLLNNIRISRCMFYVSEILRKLVCGEPFEGIKVKATAAKKIPFVLSPEKRQSLVLSEKPVSATEFCRCLYTVANDENMHKLTYTKLTEWLVSRGILEECTFGEMQGKKVPTELGRQLGISVEKRNGMYGEHNVVVYDRDAQSFILDNLDSLCAFAANYKSSSKETPKAEI